VATDESGVLLWLVGTQVGDESTIAKRSGVTVEHQHAAAAPGKREQLTDLTVGIEVSGERFGGRH